MRTMSANPYLNPTPGLVTRAPLIVQVGILWRILTAAEVTFTVAWYYGKSANPTALGWCIVGMAIVGGIALAIEVVLTTFRRHRWARRIAKIMI